MVARASSRTGGRLGNRRRHNTETSMDADCAANGASAVSGYSTPPSAGPTNPPETTDPVWICPFARPRSSRRTSEGSMAGEAARNATVAVPSRNAITNRAGTLCAPSATRTISVAARTARDASATHNTVRRSIRSMSAPAWRLNSSQGSPSATCTSATRTGLVVSPRISSGIATVAMPSARAPEVVEASSQGKALPWMLLKMRSVHSVRSE